MSEEVRFIIMIFAVVGVSSTLLIGAILAWVFRPRVKIREPAKGRLEVTGAPFPMPRTVYQEAEVIGILRGEGIEPRVVEVSGIMKVELLPVAGDEYPVTYCRQNPDQVRIDWESVPTKKDQAKRLAEDRIRLGEESQRLEEKSRLLQELRDRKGREGLK